MPAKLDIAKSSYPGKSLVTDENDVNAAAWWDRYKQSQESVRNFMYGSVLTPSDIKEFEGARVSPTTDPAVLKKNLADQANVIANALVRKAKAMKAAGYDESAINEAYGVDAAQQWLADRGAEPKMVKPAAAPLGQTDQGAPPSQANMAPPVPGATRMNVGPGARPLPTPDKVQLLKQFAKNPDAVAAFDEIYGRGAAQHFLSGGQ
jgi:hypothetical protein